MQDEFGTDQDSPVGRVVKLVDSGGEEALLQNRIYTPTPNEVNPLVPEGPLDYFCLDNIR